MCHFISWYEKKNEVIFLTGEDVFKTKRGKKLQNYCKSPDDLAGHGAILWYFDIQNKTGLIEKECTDFSTPDNFPEEIVEAIKAGKMRGLGVGSQLLTNSAWAKYNKITRVAYAEYEKIEQAAYAEYDKIRLAAYAKYEKIEQPAYAEYNKIEQPAYAEYDKIEQAAYADYNKIKQDAFWDLFAKKSNRNPLWR